MSMSAVVMMVVGVAIIWGGLGASIWNAVRVSRQK